MPELSTRSRDWAPFLFRSVQLACGSGAHFLLGLQMGIYDMLCWAREGHRLYPASLVHVAVGCLLCAACAVSADSPETRRIRWLTLRMVCLRSCATAFRLTSLCRPPPLYMIVVIMYGLAVLSIVVSYLQLRERAVYACVVTVCGACGVVAAAGKPDTLYGRFYDTDIDIMAFLQALALMEAFLALALAGGRLYCKTLQDAELVPVSGFAAVVPSDTTGERTPDQSLVAGSLAAAQTAGECSDSGLSRPSRAVSGSQDSGRSLCSLWSDATDASQRPDSAIIEQFAIRSLQHLVATALVNSENYPGDGTHTVVYMSTDAVQVAPSSCHAPNRDWIQFLEGVWHVDSCCAGCTPEWAFSLQFRGGSITCNSGLEGNLVLRDRRWHLEGAPLVWISDTLIARYSRAGDHLVWTRQASP
eukprot:TRINITY_DN56643_c1_g1_i5.p1 TRINITY_DN56643_c1_g1~~TRINITY_DN56643_c1_g1_i5.p1  ORF type:complete len:416 (+),score=9.38 TRINITY_DN56643_c1_g1_i5:99-1346(+)